MRKFLSLFMMLRAPSCCISIMDSKLYIVCYFYPALSYSTRYKMTVRIPLQERPLALPRRRYTGKHIVNDADNKRMMRAVVPGNGNTAAARACNTAIIHIHARSRNEGNVE